MAGLAAGDLRHRIRIERLAAAAAFAAESWVLHRTMRAALKDVAPSRDERLAEGLAMGSRRTRVRIRWQADITPAMRVVIGGRIMRIVGGPSDIGFREGLELMVEDWSTQGAAA